jgi:hypothetical protein
MVIGPYPIGFTLTFFGTDYTQFWLSSNGWFTFTSTTASELTNYNIPSTSGCENMVAWFWDDMDPPEALVLDKHCYYGNADVDGDGDQDFVISFVHYPKYRSGGSLAGDWLTAQAVLYNDAPAGNDRVRLHYEDYGPDIILNSATVGIENAAGTEGVEYHYNGTKGPIFNAQPDVALCLMMGPDDTQIPVELSSFSGVGGAGYATLRWETATEHENLGYYLLRKAAGVETFVRVNQELVPGAGTTLEPQVYEYRDEGLAAGTYQYKLVDVSFDGATVEHGPIALAVGEGLPLAYSIQAKSGDPVEFALALPVQTPMNLAVYDLAGREVWTMEREDMAPGVYTIAWPGLTAVGSRAASSTYVYRVRCGDAFVQTGKVVLLR